ncbi:hypothetical protein DY000_02058798 [Brassica cretica]|uniref:Uncharacterized protein n=1 Tax=Brassica cretica TaxID=69181 RepID=A0ABQ7ANM5_BRACR|nr:hypothetical protein DY000_02058798 [Brassica cretica]
MDLGMFGRSLKNFVAFTTFVSGVKTKYATGSATGSGAASVSGSSGGCDDDDGRFDLAGNYEKLYEHWLKLVEENSDLVNEKAKLETQVAEALKYESEKEEEAQQAGDQLVETQKGLRMLNNGTNQLDHLLSIGQSDRCGLGYQGKCSKAEGAFVSVGKTKVLAMFDTKPEECENLLKQKKRDDKNDSDTDSNDGEKLKNFVAFTTFASGVKTKYATGSATGSAAASVSGSSGGCDDDAESEDDDDGRFDLAGNYKKLYEHWLKLVEENSDLVKEKAKLETQVAEALKYESEKEEEAQQADDQLAETQKGLRMLNNETNQLDHLLSIGQSDRCGLGYQGECSKAEGAFVSAGKTKDLATFDTKPEVKRNSWSKRFDHYGDGGMRFPPHFGGYGFSY